MRNEDRTTVHLTANRLRATYLNLGTVTLVCPAGRECAGIEGRTYAALPAVAVAVVTASANRDPITTRMPHLSAPYRIILHRVAMQRNAIRHAAR